MFILGFLALMLCAVLMIGYRYSSVNFTGTSLAGWETLILWGGIICAVLAVYVLLYGAIKGSRT